MKRIKLLITLSLTLLVLAFGSFSVFAVDVGVGDIVSAGVYVMDDDFSDYPFNDTVRFNMSFSNNDIQYDYMSFYYGPTLSDLYSISYFPRGENTPAQLWLFNTGWVDESYRYIVLNEDLLISDDKYVYLFSKMSFLGSSGSVFVSDIFELFQSIIVWLVGFFGAFVGLFWTSTSGLTVLGVLAVIALGISIFFLIFAVVINFFRFRGR